MKRKSFCYGSRTVRERGLAVNTLTHSVYVLVLVVCQMWSHISQLGRQNIIPRRAESRSRPTSTGSIPCDFYSEHRFSFSQEKIFMYLFAIFS